MKRGRRALVSILLALAAIAPVIRAGSEVRGPAPSISLRDTSGKKISLVDFRGKPVLVHFWATWCEACRREMPLLEEFARAHAGKATVLGINLGERRKLVSTYVVEHNLTIPILLDTRGKAAARYGVTALPATFLVDADGAVVADLSGAPLQSEELDKRLKPLLAPGTE